jgi:hypothetical protein
MKASLGAMEASLQPPSEEAFIRWCDDGSLHLLLPKWSHPRLGRVWPTSLGLGGEVEGLDYFFRNLLEVFCVFIGPVCIFSEVLLMICTTA